jgi:hypothetical protein
MGPSSNVTHALNIVVKGITILYFLFCQTSVLLVEQIMHAIYFIYIYISITASKICYNDIDCFSNALPYINALGKLPLSTEYNKLIISDHQFPVKFRFKMALFIVITINLFLKYSKLLMTPPYFISMKN